MTCPTCGSENSKVTDSRTKSGVYRRRKCLDCNERFSTLEDSFTHLLDVLEEGGLGLTYVDKVSNILAEAYDIRHKPEKRVNPRQYTEKDDRILRKYYPVEGAKKTAERLEKSVRSVQARANRIGVQGKNTKFKVGNYKGRELI